MNNNEPKIVVPKRLIQTLIHCIKLQKTVSTLNDKTAANEAQSLIDSTIYWADSFLSLKSNTSVGITLEEALEFVKVQKDSVSCDFIESDKCHEVVVEPNYLDNI